MPEVLTMRGVTRDYSVGSGFARKQTLRALRGVDLGVKKKKLNCGKTQELNSDETKKKKKDKT